MKPEIYICIACIVAVLVIASVILFITLSKKKQAKKNSSLLTSIIKALGDKENIIEMVVKGSRVSVKLNDNSKLNQEELKNLGITSLIFMSNKITFVAGSIAQDIYNEYTK